MLTYLKREINSKERRSIIRYMSQYKNIEAIIQSKKLDLMPSRTSSIKENPVQESNEFRSEAETYTINSMKIDEYEAIKKLLDIAYNSVKPIQKKIWEEHFIDGRKDTDVYYGNDIAKRTYYKEKDELIRVVAECLRVGTN